MKKTFKIIVLSFLLVALIAAVYTFYDISTLVFYENEKILSLYPFGSKVYLVTENGNGYMSGDNSNSKSFKYRGAEDKYHSALGITSPARFFDGEITRIFPYCKTGALFITSDNQLYKVSDFEAQKIADSAVFATASDMDTVYIIDTNNDLFVIKDNEKKFLYKNVVTVQAYRDRIFAVLDNGDFCELLMSDQGAYTPSDPIFKNAKSVSVVDTSLRYKDKFIYDDEDAISNPLITVLTTDGKLYVKGAYNLISCGYYKLSADMPEPAYISDWKLIGENVTCFSSSAMGTVMKFDDNTSTYYGFDSFVDSSAEFGYKDFEVSDVESVYSGDLCVYIRTQDGTHYIWGSSYNELLQKENNCNIFTGNPKIIYS